MKRKAAILNNGIPWMGGLSGVEKVYGGGRMDRLREWTDLVPGIVTGESVEERADELRDVEVVFSTWGMPALTERRLEYLPNLKAVFYAAGATSRFREPFLERGVIVCSAAAANAVPVAEFALAQVLLAGAGYFQNSREYMASKGRDRSSLFRGHGNYGGRVALLGNGAISHKLQEFLGHHALDVAVVPSRKERRTLSLEDAFSTSFAVVNLFPDRDDNAGVLNASLFERMIEHAVFINVGRGRQVDEAGLIGVLKQRPDLTALLDVQWPEPPEENSELYTLPNVRLSGHIAGSTGTELYRMADFMIEEFERYARGEPLMHEVRPDQL